MSDIVPFDDSTGIVRAHPDKPWPAWYETMIASEEEARRAAGLPEPEWKHEDRPVGNNQIRGTLYKGEHRELCKLTEDGWICFIPCNVTDMPQQSTIHHTVDELIEIEHHAKRKVLVHWSLERHSCIWKFTNGRCQVPFDQTLHKEIWHRGRTLTLWGARRKMSRLAEPPK